MAKSTKTQSTTVPRTTRPRRPRSAPATTAAGASTPNASFTHGDIALRAYELYLAGGGMPGRELDHWLTAENELRDRSVASGN